MFKIMVTIPERLKKIFLIAGFTIIVGAMFWVIYLVFFRPAPEAIVPNDNSANINGLPRPGNSNVNGTPVGNVNGLPLTNTTTGTSNRVANGGATIVDTVIPDSTGSMTSTQNGNLQFYDHNSGKFYRLSPDGTTKTALTDAVYKDVQRIAWSPSGNRAVLTFPDNSKIMYDFERKKQYTLPPELNQFAFSPNSTQLVSKYLDDRNQQNQWLMITNADGTGAQSVEQLGENADKVTASWSANNVVVGTYEKAVNSDASEIIFLGKNGENLPSAQVEGRGFIPNWSPDGDKLLYSTYSQLNDNVSHLYIMNGSAEGLGKNIVDLGLDTSADKCTYSQDNYTIYCAVPFYPVSNSGISPSLGFSVPDNIYSIDILRGTTTLVARPVDQNGRQTYSVGSISLSTDESILYFTDVNTGHINRILLR